MTHNIIHPHQKHIYLWSIQPSIQPILECMYSRFVSTYQEADYVPNINYQEMYYKFISMIYHLRII